MNAMKSPVNTARLFFELFFVVKKTFFFLTKGVPSTFFVAKRLPHDEKGCETTH